MTSRRTKRAVGYWIFRARVFVFLLAASTTGPLATAEPADPPSVALLGVQFLNDNEGLEPTTDAERARLARTEKEFVEQLAAGERYRIIRVPDDVRAKIAVGQAVGECGGCEFDFGKQLGPISSRGSRFKRSPT